MIMILRTTFISIHSSKLRSIVLSLFYLVSLSACVDWLPEAHRIDLQQGNTVKLEQLEALEIGMDKNEVRKIMGEPMLADPFHPDRWDYIYRFTPRKGFERKSLLTLYFENEQLSKIDDTQYIEP
jgi:outer membrane protein assembly factor BamE